ncbi:hypothetical protein NHX12_012537 [Muraenolepis orangiensis]|uniref:Uncharacterized protein n=1 Tax=Muraenolepis orangiensis TaxID=630683 RepID=A0A9Q0I774_9TELE|nr:hypothetical protein NHX12_012537 [Muraenolepis orangiensis]
MCVLISYSRSQEPKTQSEPPGLQSAALTENRCGGSEVEEALDTASPEPRQSLALSTTTGWWEFRSVSPHVLIASTLQSGAAAANTLFAYHRLHTWFTFTRALPLWPELLRAVEPGAVGVVLLVLLDRHVLVSDALFNEWKVYLNNLCCVFKSFIMSFSDCSLLLHPQNLAGEGQYNSSPPAPL